MIDTVRLPESFMRAFLILSVAALLAAPALAQPPSGGGGGGERGRGERGGFGGGGGMRGMNADDSFNRMLQSYNGSGDVVDYSRISPEYREQYNRRVSMMGGDPLPTTGTINRTQYADAFAKRMEAVQQPGVGGGGNGFGRGPGGGGERGMNSERAMAEEARAKAEGARISGSMVIQGAPGQPTVIHGLQPQPGMNVVISGPGGPQPGDRPVDEE